MSSVRHDVHDEMWLRQRSAAGLDVFGRAELVVEIRSPHDETYEKFAFYARHDVQQVLVIHPATRLVELYDLDGDGYRLVEPGLDGTVTIACLDADLVTVDTDDGPRLQISIGATTTSV